MNVPDAVGVPLIVIVLVAHAAVTPAGKPVATPIPVAPVVVCVIAVSAVLIHNVGVLDAALTVLAGVIVIVGVVDNSVVHPVAVVVTSTLNVVSIVKFPVGKFKLLPLPVRAEPILVFDGSFLN